MEYMLLMYANEAEKPTQEEMQALGRAWHAFNQEVAASGVWVANGGLCPTSDATTVRVRGGKTLTADGPFAETHEQLGGYVIVNCRDLDEAISWAAKLPTSHNGSVEVRPVSPYSRPIVSGS
jgi:hypothetical protein